MSKKPPTQEPQANAAPQGEAEAPRQPLQAPLDVPPGGWPADEFTGQSGSFVRDPVTGVRRRA